MNEPLFTRRSFLTTATTAIAATQLRASGDVFFGKRGAGFVLDPDWGLLPAGMNYGYGCAIVADSHDRIFVTTRSINPCVAVFDAAGKLLETWSQVLSDKIGYSTEQIKDTAHGLYASREPDGEFLYWTENVSTNKSGAKFGKRVIKTDMQANVLFTLGPDEKDTEKSRTVPLSNPTDVAVAPNGDIYVVDGYGSQKVYRFDRAFKQLKVIGEPGKGHGQFNTCHGVWVSTLKSDPEVYIADRGNDRIEVYSPELEYKRTITGVRKPCCFYQHGGQMFVPELDARVSVFDENDVLVAHLGDGKGIDPKQISKHPDKFAAPHALTCDSKGNLYVIEWLSSARPRKLIGAGR